MASVVTTTYRYKRPPKKRKAVALEVPAVVTRDVEAYSMANTEARKLVAFAAVFTVSDVGRSLEFYLCQLGFGELFRLGDPISYAIVERDAVSLHLMPASQEARGLGQSSIYVFAANVDDLHNELQALDCPIEKVPANYPYGMREMSVRDLDGNRITFGQEVTAPDQTA